MDFANYKNVIATTATFSTVANMFSGVLVCRDIYKQGTAEGKDPVPFVGGIGMGILLLVLGYIMKKVFSIELLIYGAVFDIMMNIIYFTFFFVYTPNKRKLIKTVAIIMAITIVLLTYAHFEDPFTLQFTWAVIVMIASFLLIGAPLLNFREIIRTKNTDILSFPMILMGTITSCQWLLYGISRDNNFMIFQNVVGLALRIVQLSLFVIYP